MINLKPKQKIIACDCSGVRIYKDSLKVRAIINEWTLGILAEYGTMENYKAIKRAETNKFIKEVLC